MTSKDTSEKKQLTDKEKGKSLDKLYEQLLGSVNPLVDTVPGTKEE